MFSRVYAHVSVLIAASLYSANAGLLAVRDDPVCIRSYTVVSGDTCDAISAAQNTSTFQLAHNNPIVGTDCSGLQPGQVLCLGFEGQDCSTVQVVVAGDTCSKIATSANVPLATLLANNPNVNAACTNIYVGEVLCTASTVIDYA
ncbi:hypothetical protein H2248_003045 [Termitomyces sp. 'cryptogamus']|nr:hypothetical protein H2248_003045 [Termitomyces sp. 'cryptogamus']